MDNQIESLAPDKILSEAVQPAPQAIKFRLPEFKHAGLRIYEYDIENDDLHEIVPVETNIISTGAGKNAIKAQQTQIQHKYKAKLNHIYVQALNLKVARKKVDKAMR